MALCKTTQAESQEDSSVTADGHQAILNKNEQEVKDKSKVDEC